MSKISLYSLLLISITTQFLILSAGLANASSPEDVLGKYISAMSNHNADPDLGIYTQQSRLMLKGWNVTPAQMDNIVNTYNKCYGPDTKYDDSYNLAVIRYSPEQKQCSPWFFQNTNGKWLIDLTMMQRAIRFGPANSWHFVPGLHHEYEFAFTDWNFNTQGYPVSSG